MEYFLNSLPMEVRSFIYELSFEKNPFVIFVCKDVYFWAKNPQNYRRVAEIYWKNVHGGDAPESFLRMNMGFWKTESHSKNLHKMYIPFPFSRKMEEYFVAVYATYDIGNEAKMKLCCSGSWERKREEIRTVVKWELLPIIYEVEKKSVVCHCSFGKFESVEQGEILNVIATTPGVIGGSTSNFWCVPIEKGTKIQCTGRTNDYTKELEFKIFLSKGTIASEFEKRQHELFYRKRNIHGCYSGDKVPPKTKLFDALMWVVAQRPDKIYTHDGISFK